MNIHRFKKYCDKSGNLVNIIEYRIRLAAALCNHSNLVS